MKQYNIDSFESKEKYIEFIKYMISKSDYFSFTYFKYRENDKTSKSTKDLYNALKTFKVHNQKTTVWPGNQTWDTKHIYKIYIYHAVPEAVDILIKADDIFDWDYPGPMDLAFFKDGYAWFASCAHEQMAWLFTDKKHDAEDLKKLGANIYYKAEYDNVFYWGGGKL